MRLAFALVAALATAFIAGEAAAQAAQCFNRYGQPYGPVWRMENPNVGWPQWVQRLGGTCRALSEFERQRFEKLPQQYPADYLAWASSQQPGYRPSPGYRPPPGYNPGPGYPPGNPSYDERDFFGDANRAAYLVGQWLANQGRPYAQVVNTGRTEFLYERQWRIFFARWNDGNRARIAVRYSRREGGSYIAMQSYDGAGWSQPQPIGQ